MKKQRVIVILPAGWVFVGFWENHGKYARLTDAACIRQWGTKRGIGELALKGVQPETVLDPCGTIQFLAGSEIAVLYCQTDWSIE